MAKETRISVLVSEMTREMVERRLIVHPKIVVTRKSGAVVLEKTRAAKPTRALRALLRDAD